MSLALPILEVGPVRPAFAQGPRSLKAVKLLRLSVTDRCNLRCIYCMPEQGISFSQRDDLLKAQDIVAVAAAGKRAGIEHFKLTGGEPTVRDDLVDIVAQIKRLQPRDLSLTTNGMLLTALARPLREAGLDRMTISWDTMREDRFAKVSNARGRDYTLDRLRRGIDAAEEAGFTRLKINVVVIGGINDDEIVDFARLTRHRSWTVRFIEYMPLGDSVLGDREPVDSAAIMMRIASELGELQPVHRDSEAGVGPAEVYRLPDAAGRIGFISAMSQPFCETCNRLRLTATGELRSCLFDGGEVSIWPALRPRVDESRLIDMMRRCVAMKPDTHSTHGNRAMSQLGG